MAHRATGLVQPGVLQFHNARLYLRVEEKGRNLGILVETAEGERRLFQVECHPTRLGAVALVEVKA